MKTNTSTRKSSLTLVTLPSFNISGAISAEKMHVENLKIYRRLYDMPPVIQTSVNFTIFSTYIFSADISPELMKLGRVTNVKLLFLVLVIVFNFDLFKFSAAILEKGLLI